MVWLGVILFACMESLAAQLRGERGKHMGLRVSDSRNALYLKAAKGQLSSTMDNAVLCLMAFDKGLNILRQPHDRQGRPFFGTTHHQFDTAALSSLPTTW
jgi:hypothetical protein